MIFVTGEKVLRVIIEFLCWPLYTISKSYYKKTLQLHIVKMVDDQVSLGSGFKLDFCNWRKSPSYHWIFMLTIVYHFQELL